MSQTTVQHAYMQMLLIHYSDVIMGAFASQITSLTIVYRLFRRRSKKTSKSASLALACEEFTGDRWSPRTNGQECGKCFHLMSSSCLHPGMLHQNVIRLLLLSDCNKGSYWEKNRMLNHLKIGRMSNSGTSVFKSSCDFYADGICLELRCQENVGY